MATALFRESRLKIERAKKHIRDFRRLENRFRKLHPYFLVLEDNPDPAKPPSQEFRWRLVVRKPAPTDDLSLITGDALHNLRAALDILACEAVRRAGKSDDQVQFPVAYKAEGVKDAITKRHIHRAGKRFVAIVRALKPYKGGNPIISPLHRLDILDKHSVVLASVAGGGIEVLRVAPLDKKTGYPRWVGVDFTREMIDGAIWQSAPAVLGLKVHGQVEPPFRIQFGKGIPFENEPIIPTLVQLTDGVLDIVKLFEARL